MIDNAFLFYFLTFALSFILTVITEKKLIPILKSKASQPIYEEGPKWHMGKQGTPTMGGLAFLFTSSFLLLLCTGYLFFTGEKQFAISLLLSLGFGVCNALIGIVDDLAKIKKKENAGLSPFEKIFLQTLAALLFLAGRRLFLLSSSSISFTFGTYDLGFLYYPLALLMLLATVNCANLTDGIDGIASGVALAIFCSLGYISISSHYSIAFISFCMIGCTLGFMIFNVHPAKIFMGDTGSLYIGALAAAACITLGNPLLIIFVGAVYLIEGLSVIIQVLYFKLTKKRVFLMAPLHHHFEKCGWSENKIVIWAISLTMIFSIFSSLVFF